MAEETKGMNAGELRSTTQINAEIEALKARIRRLRLEKKMAALAEMEGKLLNIANGATSPDEESDSPTQS